MPRNPDNPRPGSKTIPRRPDPEPAEPAEDEQIPGLEPEQPAEPEPAAAEPIRPKRGRPPLFGPKRPKPEARKLSEGTRKKIHRERVELSNAQLAAQLEAALEKVGALLLVTAQLTSNPRLDYDGQVVIARAKPVAAELALLAKKNPAVERALRMLFTGGDLTRAVLVLASVAVPIAANHGAFPEHVFDQIGPLLGAPPLPPRPGPDGNPVAADFPAASVNGSSN